MIFNSLKIRIFFVFILVVLFSCNIDDNDVPDEYVNFSVSVYDAGYQALQFQGGFVYVKGGAYDNGIILYRGSNNTIYAYDRTCPYEASAACRVCVDEDWGNLATDSVCGSQFLLGTESIIKGPATHFLKTYQTSFNLSSGRVYVYN